MTSLRDLAASLAVLCLGCSGGPAGSVDVGPICTVGPPAAVVSVVVGYGSACTLDEAGSLVCWGARRGVREDIRPDRTLHGPLSGASYPVPVPNVHDVVSLSLGGDLACSVTRDGSRWCWGESRYLGAGTGLEPLQVSSPATTSRGTPGWDLVETSIGNSPHCIRTRDARTFCWGEFLTYAFSDGPVNAVQIEAGTDHACAVIGDGRVSCWGNNVVGSLGDGTTTSRRAPVDALGITDAVAVSSATGLTCALHSTGRVSCWGQFPNVDGVEIQPTPVPIPGIEDAAQISAGRRGFYARLASGQLVAWGQVDAPVHGTGDRLPGLYPWTYLTLVPVDGMNDVLDVSTDGATTCVLRRSGEVWCWGSGEYGQRTTALDVAPWPPTRVRGLVCL